MEGLTVYLTRIVLVAVAAAAFTAWWRHRGRIRRDIALNLAVLTLTGSVGVLHLFFPNERHLLDHIALAAVVAHPWALSVLSDHLVMIPRRVRLAIGSGFVIGTPLVFATGTLPAAWAAALVLSYFVLSETFLAGATFRAARETGGITRSRLQLAALAPLFLIGAAIVWAAGSQEARLLSVAYGLGHLALALAAVATYVGFAPPRTLRHLWRLKAMEEHVETSMELPLAQGFRPIAEHLMAAAVAVTGGTRALMVLRPMEEERFLLIEDRHPTLLALPRLDGAVATAWDEDRPVVLQRGGRHTALEQVLLERTGATALLLVPFASRSDRWGLIGVAYGWQPLFGDEDAEMLTLIGRHSAMLLDQGRILEEQADLIQDLRVQAGALERSNEELRAFSYAVSHDIRTPMVTHMWLMEELQDLVGPMRDSPQVKERFGQMQHNLDGMWALTSDLLELARINQEPEAEETVDLGALIDEVIRSAREHHPEKEVRFEYDTRTLPRVVGERVRFQQLFANLIGNAVKYGRDEGALVRVDVVQTGRPPAGALQVRISDNGPGVCPEDRERIFQVCVRGRDRLDRKIPGTGIGLAIAKKVAHQYDGDLYMTDVEGGGACFVFEMPMLRMTGLDAAFRREIEGVDLRSLPMPDETPAALPAHPGLPTPGHGPPAHGRRPSHGANATKS